MAGLGRAMPYTMTAFLIGSLSIVGLPPLGGSWSKFYIALGSLEGGQAWMVAVLMISSVLNIAYLLPIPIRAFFGTPPDDQHKDQGEAPLACLLAIGITATACILLFFYPQTLFELASSISPAR